MVRKSYFPYTASLNTASSARGTIREHWHPRVPRQLFR